MAAKKASSATKTAAKKTTAKKAASTVKRTAKKVETDPSKMSLEQVAAASMAGKFGTGRERDIALVAAGHDPLKVQRKVARIRSRTA